MSPGAPPRAMVLAAGLGQRLRPLSARLPKPLVPILNQPLLTANLLLLRAAGVREVIVNLHYQGQAVQQVLGDGNRYGLDIRYSVESQLLGTGGGVRRALPWLAEHGTFFVLNGDTLVDCDLQAALARHRQRGSSATLLLHPHPQAAAHGAIGLDAGGRVEAIGALLGPRCMDPLLFAGVHVLEPDFCAGLPDGEESCIIRQAYVPAIRRGDPVFGDPCVSFWADLGTPARYLEAHRTLLAGPGLLPHLPRPDVPAPPGLTVIPPVLLGPGLRLVGRATVGPDVVIGSGAMLAEGVRVERSVVWPGAQVLADCRDGVLLDDGNWVSVPPAAV